MKKIFLTCVFLLITSNAQAAFTIFACEMEWAALAREIAGDKVVVLLGTSPMQDASRANIGGDISKNLRKAEMVFCSGGGLENSWLQKAIIASGNSALSKSPEAIMFAYDYAAVRPEVSKVSDLAIKNVFPRVHLNPNNLLPIAAEFSRRMAILDKRNDFFYKKSYSNFAANWKNMISIWEKMAAPLKGKKVVIPDDSWLGLANWIGFEVFDRINLEQDSAKNEKKLTQLSNRILQDRVFVIISSMSEDQNFTKKLGRLSKTNVVLLPFTVGGGTNSGSLSQIYVTSVNLLLANCSKNLCSTRATNDRVAR